MQKVVFLKAYFAPVGREETIQKPTGEKKEGIFGIERNVYETETRFRQTGYSTCVVDSERLGQDLSDAVEKLNKEGFKVKTVTPVISGNYNFNSSRITSSKRALSDTEAISGGGSFGYGYSYTDSLLIVAEKVK